MGCLCPIAYHRQRESDQEIDQGNGTINTSRAQKYKVQGKQHYNKGDYDRAIESYNKAVRLDPQNHKYHTNLSVCWRKKENWKQVKESAETALQLEPNNMKALMFKALSLSELSKTLVDGPRQASVQQSQKLLDDLVHREDIGYLRNQIQSYITQLQQLKRAYRAQQLSKANVQFGEYISSRLDSLDLSKTDLKGFYGSKKELMGEMARFISKLSADQIPDYFQDPINYEIFQKPVIVQSGMTYEASVLKQHVRTNGPSDPITREPLDINAVVENKTLIQLINSHSKITRWKIQKTTQNPMFIKF